MTERDSFRQAVLRCCKRMGLNPISSVEFANMMCEEFSALRAEHQRLREACESALHVIRRDIPVEQPVSVPGIARILKAALEPRKEE